MGNILATCCRTEDEDEKNKEISQLGAVPISRNLMIFFLIALVPLTWIFPLQAEEAKALYREGHKLGGVLSRQHGESTRFEAKGFGGGRGTGGDGWAAANMFITIGPSMIWTLQVCKFQVWDLSNNPPGRGLREGVGERPLGGRRERSGR